MPRGMAWLRFSMATVQRILCQWGRTVAASRHHGAAPCPRPTQRSQGRRARIRAAQQPRLPGTSRTPRDVNRCTCQCARIGGCRCSSGRFVVQMLHAPCGARTRPCGRTGMAVQRRVAPTEGEPRHRPGHTPVGASVANVRNEAARHRVHDAQPALGAARRLATRRGPWRADWGAGLAGDSATRLPRARPHDLARRPAHLAPAGEEKNGRRPHRCLQSGREVALRRPQNLDHEVRRRSKRRTRH